MDNEVLMIFPMSQVLGEDEIEKIDEPKRKDALEGEEYHRRTWFKKKRFG